MSILVAPCEYNPNKCLARSKKRDFNQCFNKPLNESEFCGIHLKSSSIFRIDEPVPISNSISSSSLNTLIPSLSLNTTYYTETNFIKNEIKEYLCRKNKLKCTINHYNINSLINPNQPRNKLFKQLRHYFRRCQYYKSHIKSIIKIQTLYRGNLIRKMFGPGLYNKCVNIEDVYTFELKTDIDINYFFSYMEDNSIYWFDIITFIKLIHFSSYNPYTRKQISINIINNAKYKIKYLERHGYAIINITDKLTDKQIIKQRMITVFHKYDELSHYTNHEWFEKLTFPQLKTLYKFAKDIWNYRASLTTYQKNRIVLNGIAFNYSIQYIHNMNISQFQELRNILLCEYDRFVTEGVNIVERRLGSLLMLTALVMISQDAALSFPHLVQ
jgi:hypothetical protein